MDVRRERNVAAPESKSRSYPQVVGVFGMTASPRVTRMSFGLVLRFKGGYPGLLLKPSNRFNFWLFPACSILKPHRGVAFIKVEESFGHVKI